MRSSFLALLSTLSGLLLYCAAATADVPQLFGVVNFQDSTGVVLVNGIPVSQFDAGADTSGFEGLLLSEWLSEGANEIVLQVDRAGDPGNATFEVQDGSSGATVVSLQQTGVGRTAGQLDGEGLPRWAWHDAETLEMADGLQAAVAALHSAYGAGDIDAVIDTAQPFFGDQAHLEGLDAAMFREQVGPIISSATLQPLPELAVSAHAQGRLFRVTGPDGQPPIALIVVEDGLTSAIRMGEWWSRIDGAWRIVR